jgi:hypothetical protein
LIGLVVAWIALLLIGGGDEPSRPGIGKAPEHKVINEEVPAFRGVPLGASKARITHRFGPVSSTNPERVQGSPLGVRPYDLKSDNAWDCVTGHDVLGNQHPAGVMRYRGVVLFTDRRSCAFITTEDGAATQRGVAIGDPMDDAERAYPVLHCGTANEDTEYATYPFCAGRLPHTWIWFGGDPIDTIQLSISPLGGG